MKTISPPIMPKPEDRVYRIGCDNKECAAVMELGHAELRYTETMRDGDFYQFNCPHCKRYITVDAKVLTNFLVPTGPTPRGSPEDWTLDGKCFAETWRKP
jgi:hypothetical protein